MAMFPIAVTGVLVWLLIAPVTKGCSVQGVAGVVGVAESVTNCLSILTDALLKANAEDALLEYCKSIECNLKCFLDAIGDCYKEDAFFVYNPNVWKATNRALCRNRTETIAAFLNCKWSDPSCLTNYKTAHVAAIRELINGNNATYKYQHCNALSTAVGCIGFTITSSCPAALASFLKDFFIAAYSYTACGIPAHAYSSKYGSDVTCTGRSLHQSVTAAIVYLILNVLGKFL